MQYVPPSNLYGYTSTPHAIMIFLYCELLDMRRLWNTLHLMLPTSKYLSSLLDYSLFAFIKSTIGLSEEGQCSSACISRDNYVHEQVSSCLQILVSGETCLLWRSGQQRVFVKSTCTTHYCLRTRWVLLARHHNNRSLRSAECPSSLPSSPWLFLPSS